MIGSRPLRRGLALTELGFGGSAIGNLYDAVDDESAAATVRAAWDAGIRYFDTAPHYGLGLSERRLGAALRDHPRAEFVVSTKVGRWLEPAEDVEPRDPEGFAVPATHRRVWDFSRDGVIRSIEASLERLGVDGLDLVLIHDPDDHARDALAHAAPTLSQLRSEGVIRAYGVGMNDASALAQFVRETDLDVAMVAGRYTLLDQTAAADLLPLALARGVGVLNAGIFNSGVLSSVRPGPHDRYGYRPVPADVLARATAIARVCGRFGVDLPTAALAFARRHPAVTSVVVGLRTPAEVRELIARADEPVPTALWVALEQEGLVERIDVPDTEAVRPESAPRGGQRTR